MKRSLDDMNNVPHNDVEDAADDNDDKGCTLTLDQCWHVFDQLDHVTKQRVLIVGLGREMVESLATHFVDERVWYNVITLVTRHVDITTLGRLRQVCKGFHRVLKDVVTVPVQRIREYIKHGTLNGFQMQSVPTRVLDDMYACFPFYYRRYCALVQEQYDKHKYTSFGTNNMFHINNRIYVKPSTRYIGNHKLGDIDLYTGCVFKPDAKKKPRGNIFLASPSPLIGISKFPGYSLYTKHVPKDKRAVLKQLERWYTTHLHCVGACVDKPMSWKKPYQHPFSYMKSKWKEFNKR